MGRHDDRVTVLHGAVDDQAGGNERRNPKIGWHGTDSFRKTASSHQKTSSRLSQTPAWVLKHNPLFGVHGASLDKSDCRAAAREAEFPRETNRNHFGREFSFKSITRSQVLRETS
jgi:hypothetical protein